MTGSERAGEATPATGSTVAKGSKLAKAERRQAKRIERRLARIHEAVTTQSKRSTEILARLTQVRRAKKALKGPAPPLGALGEGALAGLERVLELRREIVVPVDEPLVLISQAQRSGGTLLARLFDGHPQCHAHPHELLIGGRIPHRWPKLRLDGEPEAWFATLQEEKVAGLFAKGRRRIPLKTRGEKPEGTYPCILPPAFQRLIFLEEVARRSPIGSEREILNCYMTSLFNGWLDNENLYGPDKRWVVAFSPRRAWGEGLGKFFERYPDGRLISVLRDPLSWYTSAQGRDPDADAAALLESCKRSAREMLEAARRYSERVCIVRFDKLVMDTSGTMRTLADFLEIDFDPRLTTPTFNGLPVGANSSHDVRRTGVVTDPVERYEKLLSKRQRERIRADCDELHDEVLGLADPVTTRETPISLATATVDRPSDNGAQ